MRTAAIVVTAVLYLGGCGGGGSAGTTSGSGGGGTGGSGGGAMDTFQVVAETDVQLLAVRSGSPDDVLLFGGQYNGAGTGKAFHYDGKAWNNLDFGTNPSLLIWSHQFSPTDVWAVGQKGMVVRWDGTSLQRLDPPGVTVDLWGIWGSSPTDMWAVGGIFGGGQGTILHYDGTTWTPYDVSGFNFGNGLPIKVWGVAPDKVWISATSGMILKYDGTTWTKDVSPIEGQDIFLVGLAGTGPNDVYTVGGSIAPPGYVLHYDGTAWKVLDDMLPQSLVNIAVIPGTGQLLTVGVNGYAAMLDATGIKKEFTPVTDILLHGITAPDKDHILVSGGNILDPTAPRGILLSLGKDPPMGKPGQ